MATHYVTASRLRDGASVWLGETAGWVDHIEAAARFEEDALARALDAAQADQARHVVVDVHAAPAPLTYREQIRALGPSVRADLGTQAGRRRAPTPPLSPRRSSPGRPMPASISTTNMTGSSCGTAQRNSAGRSNAGLPES